MNRFQVYVQETLRLIERYTCQEPLASYLKKQLSADKRKGSRDRKAITDMVFRYYRLGNAFPERPIQERLMIALFLTTSTPDPLLSFFKPEWKDFLQKDLYHKLQCLNTDPSQFRIFQMENDLSEGVDYQIFHHHFLLQPSTFVRIRPGYEEKVLKGLSASGLHYEMIRSQCVRLPPMAKLESIFSINREIVIQDASSQRVIGQLDRVFNKEDSFTAWDCCAASGGKSIQLVDAFPKVKLTVTDIRESIMVNLKKRFQEASIRAYKSVVVDLSKPHSFNDSFDLIVADVPCSGSGTWARTPEQLQCFSSASLEKYVLLQQKILTNVIPHLKNGGYLLYSTCSAFQLENEMQASWMEKTFSLQQITSQLLNGIEEQADTMYVALFKKKG